MNEMKLDNLFLLEDGSVAIIDYESSVKWENNLKYVNYIVRVLGRYKKEERPKQIRMIVIYTADVEHAEDTFTAGCLTLKLEQAFLSRMDSEGIRSRIEQKIRNKEALSDEELMEFIVLPLTYKGTEAKQEAVKDAVELAKQIEDREEQTFLLSGILVFADKIIDSETAKYIREVMRMTQVAELFLEEGRAEVRAEAKREKEKIIINMYKFGDKLDKIAQVTDTDIEQVKQVIMRKQ